MRPVFRVLLSQGVYSSVLQIDFAKDIGWPVSGLAPLRLFIIALLWLSVMCVLSQATGLQLVQLINKKDHLI